MSATHLILIVLVILLLVGLPGWGVAPAQWGYYPSGALGIVVAIVLILLLLGRL